jgi:tetratricopeptide (TPR) repeat protein
LKKMRLRPSLVALLACVVPVCGQTAGSWSLAANPHFEVYSQRDSASAVDLVARLERLRAWMIREAGLQPDRLRPARVIAFGSAAEYRTYRLHSNAEAYYIGTEGRDYIVFSLDSPRASALAAHEYAHMALHSAGIELPRWLSEGLAEVFATLSIDDASGALGGDRPEHSQLLRRAAWIPLPDLLRVRDSKDQPALFYAESWALSDMLSFSSDYRSKLRALVGALAAMSPESAFATVHARTLDEVAADLRSWIDRRKTTSPLKLAGVAPDAAPARISEIGPLRARVLLAGLLLDAGDLHRAESLYRDLLHDAPLDGDVQAGLGTIVFQRGDAADARQRWARALELGVSDDALCYRYFALANSRLPDAEARALLERAVALRPNFDEARYSLALMEKNAGNDRVALDHLRAMRPPSRSRAFAYWSAIADALNTLDRYDEAEAAAQTASTHASTPAEKTRAAELAYLARTELAVRVAPDAAGRPKMVTTRVPRRATDWNPFVEPQDDVRRAEGTLREIDCAGTATRFVVETGTARLVLTVADPSRVRMLNAPPEFTCGPQNGEPVSVVYAAAQSGPNEGVVRGIEFHAQRARDQ